MEAASTVNPIDATLDLAHLRSQRIARRRQLVGFLVAAALVTGYVGWIAVRHQAAASWLEANNYKVIWGIDRDNWKQGGVTTVRYTAQFNFLQSAYPNGDLKFLSNLHRVEELDLSTLTGMSDADLANLGALSELRSLNLDRSRHPVWINPVWINPKTDRLTDATLVRIKHLRRLRELNLGGQPITDAGLANLAGLDQLRSLDLRGTEITDAGLEHLKALPRLKSLDLSGTKVTVWGISQFEAASPGVVVEASLPPPAR